MQKVIYAERRSGQDRRMERRRGFTRFLMEFWKPSTYRRHKTRRTAYIRKQTYTVFMPDRI